MFLLLWASVPNGLRGRAAAQPVPLPLRITTMLTYTSSLV